MKTAAGCGSNRIGNIAIQQMNEQQPVVCHSGRSEESHRNLPLRRKGTKM